MNNEKLTELYDDYIRTLNSNLWSGIKEDLSNPKLHFKDKNYFSRMTKKEFIEYIREQIRAEWEAEGDNE